MNSEFLFEDANLYRFLHVLADRRELCLFFPVDAPFIEGSRLLKYSTYPLILFFYTSLSADNFLGASLRLLFFTSSTSLLSKPPRPETS